jgi:hypothetical protein
MVGTLTSFQFAIYGDIKKALGEFCPFLWSIWPLLIKIGATGGVEIAK